MGFVMIGFPVIAFCVLFAFAVVARTWSKTGIVVGLLLWPFISVAVAVVVERGLTLLCVDEVEHPDHGPVKVLTGYCPINYYRWMDWP